MKEIKLTDTQLKLIKIANDETKQAMDQAQALSIIAQNKRKSLEDLLSMFCESVGIDKAKSEIDLDRGMAVEKDAPAPSAAPTPAE